MSKNTIYICGNSLSYTRTSDPMWVGRHWTTKLAKKIPDKKIKNISDVGAGNFSVALQIEEAMSDPDTYFVIINPSDVFRTLLPINRNRGLKKAPEIDKNLVDLSNRSWHENFFKKTYSEFFLLGTKLRKHIVTVGERLPKQKTHGRYLEFGPWSFKSDYVANNISHDELSYMISYYEKHFDLSVAYTNDYSLLEGKYFKLKSKNIPFLFSHGGMYTKIMKLMYPEVKEEVDPDLLPFYTELKLEDLKKSVLHQQPGFHLNDVDELEMVAELYYNKIKEIAGYTNT